MSQNHPYRRLRVPSDAPFELKPSPGKGWGAFATRRIGKGAMILKEKPLFLFLEPHDITMEGDIWRSIQQLAPSEKAQFLCLRDNASKPFTRMTEACAENCFSLPNSTRSKVNGPPIYGLFLLQSRFNHSCIPNSKVPTSDADIITSFATRDIVAGEEITFCYNTDFECRTRADRHRLLCFVCDCKACLTGTLFQQISDMRRRLIRGLQYLTLGVDLNGERQGSASPIIVDPQLKRAAEGFMIPLSARLIYNILVVYLLEEEGLLDHFMIERFNPGILTLAARFETESNARIARLVTVQKTSLDKLNMAFRLYGRADAADHTTTMSLRMLNGLSVTP
ncbi:set domain-containing protein 5 [Phlyctema vagabunda]|uniref:Set domain-containing protein 5 n=1 Tax=Phlyctema vagabunda TaxID=108571 RepID=A0ABR4PRT1_9HELO